MASRLWSLWSRGTAPADEDGWPEDIEAGGRITDANDVRRVLEDCCRGNAEGLVLSFEDRNVARARFVAVGDEVFQLAVEGELPARLRPPTQCSVSLRFGQRNRVFIATILAVRPQAAQGEGLELLLKIPSEIAAGDPRMAFRVPILKADDLSIEVRVNGARVEHARPLNVSLIGILVETPRGDVDIPGDADVRVAIRRGQTQATLRAELRRRYERCVALFFPDVLQDGRLEPPLELRTIVRELELLWLRQRAR